MKDKSKGKKKDGPGASKKRVKKGKAGTGNRKKAPPGLKLKYPFNQLDKGKSFVVEGADKPAGKVTILQNVKVLSYEFGKRYSLKFRVKRTDDGQVECTRIR